jgi:hypothetical protein
MGRDCPARPSLSPSSSWVVAAALALALLGGGFLVAHERLEVGAEDAWTWPLRVVVLLLRVSGIVVS